MEEVMDDNIIFAYTRQDAIDDGVFVDVTETAKEAGFKFPVAVTSNLYSTYINPYPMPVGQDKDGRLWDVITMLLFAIRQLKKSDDTNMVTFKMKFGQKVVELWAVIEAQSPTDSSPAINIMLPEDY
jgi:hypothetical protein